MSGQRLHTPDDLPLLVLVTGAPGAGKTTLAGPLAAQLGLPLFARDDLKEVLFDELGAGDVEWSRRLGGATFRLLALVTARLLEAGSSLVIEANFFRGASEAAFERFPPHRLVQVHCFAPTEMVLARVSERSGRHPGHLDEQRSAEVAARVREGVHEPLDRPGAVLRVDTSHPVDVAALADRIREAASAGSG